MQKNWSTAFNIMVTARAYIIKTQPFLLYLLNRGSICNQTLYHHTPEYPVQKWSRSRSQQRFKMLENVCPDDIFWTTDHFDTKLGMVMQHDVPESQAEEQNCCLQCQGHSEGLYNQNVTISTPRSWSQQRVKMSVFVQMISTTLPSCCCRFYETLYCDALPWVGVHAKRWVCYF